jgi:hypothetical protein
VIVFSGPARLGWQPFGGLGQVTATVSPPEAPMSEPSKSSPLPKIAEVLGLMAAGALVLYLIMIFTEDSQPERRFGP